MGESNGQAGGATGDVDLAATLAPHYSRFRVASRLLLTGHSHQAWPDTAFEAQQRAWLDAADLVDDKWAKAAEVADIVQAGWRARLGDHAGDIALGQNTHELVVRLLSAVLHHSRTTLITTDGEFHTIRRQVDRLAEAGVDVIKVAAQPAASLAERIARRVDDRTACVLVSSVLFETAEIVPDLSAAAEACERHGAALLVDAYHHVGVVPFDIAALGLSYSFIVGGGYKYCQLGEGNCFLRIPPDCDLRPVITGWFGEFAELAAAAQSSQVPYGTGAARFAGATYDPTAHYRAAAVFAFHAEMKLSAERLRAISQRQVSMLVRGFRTLDVDPNVAAVVDMRDERRAGFVAIRAPRAAEIVAALRARGVMADARGRVLRLGPAPYLSGRQLNDAIQCLGHTLRDFSI